MLNYFCSNCGGKNLYQFQKPKFCSHCGSSFSVGTTIQPQIKEIKSNKFEVNITKPRHEEKINKNIDIDNNYDDSNQENISYSSMTGLDVDIHSGAPSDGIKLGDLVSNAEASQVSEKSSQRKQSRKRGRKKIAKMLPEGFVSEARMSGRNYGNDIEVSDIEE